MFQERIYWHWPTSKNESSVENIFSYSMVCQGNIAAEDGPEGRQRSVNENKTKQKNTPLGLRPNPVK